MASTTTTGVRAACLVVLAMLVIIAGPAADAKRLDLRARRGKKEPPKDVPFDPLVAAREEHLHHHPNHQHHSSSASNFNEDAHDHYREQASKDWHADARGVRGQHHNHDELEQHLHEVGHGHHEDHDYGHENYGHDSEYGHHRYRREGGEAHSQDGGNAHDDSWHEASHHGVNEHDVHEGSLHDYEHNEVNEWLEDPYMEATGENWNEEHATNHEHEENFSEYNLDDPGFEHNLDLEKRLENLFPHVDVNHDGKISVNEMVDWNIVLTKKMARITTKQEFATHDSDGDGFVTFSEYTYDDGSDDQEPAWREYLKSTNRTFHLADKDKDGKLNLKEYHEFVHPEDSADPFFQEHIRSETIKVRDEDNDDKLSLKEFADTMYYDLQDWPTPSKGDQVEHPEFHAEISDDHPWMMKVKEKFNLIDRNRDGYIEEAELVPVMGHIRPPAEKHAREHAHRLMAEADDDRDGILTLQEMKNNVGVFYSAAYDFESSQGHHDEL